jgi:hypothetical protein
MENKRRITPRSATKYFAQSLVAIKVDRTVNNAVADHTRFRSDSLIVEALTGLVGWSVAGAVSPITDKAVDKTFDFVAEKWGQRKTKQNKSDEK